MTVAEWMLTAITMPEDEARPISDASAIRSRDPSGPAMLKKALWRFKRAGSSQMRSIRALSLYAEAQLTGWVAWPPELHTSQRAAPAKASEMDAGALLARFYSSQEC